MLSDEKKNIDKKINNGTNNKVQNFSRHVQMFYANKQKNQVISVSSEYIKGTPNYFNINRPGQVKDLRNISALKREKLRRNFNQTATN